MNKQFDVPIVMIVYRRLDLTKRSFEAVRKLQPKKLYIIADGARSEEDKEKTLSVRQYLDTHIDWDCEVHRNYADHNYGLRYRMPSGMQWVFETEESAIFIEDDVEASQSFFYYCKDLLEHYKDDDRVLMISGSNIFSGHESFGKDDICFSMFASIWGWACWKRSYKLYDVNIRTWPQVRKRKVLKKCLLPQTYDFFWILFDDLQYHWYRTWGYQWTYLMLTGKGLGIVPKYNLISNIGMGDQDAEHKDDTKDTIEFVSNVERKELRLPVSYPERIVRNEEYDVFYQKQVFREKNSLFKCLKYSIREKYYEWVYGQIKLMEQDKKYMEENLPEELILSEEEKKYNPGDLYRLTSPKQMRRDAKAYRKYKKKNG